MANTGIGDWDAGYLLRFIKAALEGDPISPPSVLQVEDVILKGNLDITKGKIVQSTGSDDGDVLVNSNGTFKPRPLAGGYDTAVKASADRATTSLVAVNVPDLTVALDANSTYEFEAVLQVASDTAAGCKYAVQYSAAGAFAFCVYTGTTTAGVAAVASTSTLNALTATAFVTAVLDGTVLIKGHVITGANPGNFTIQQAKVTSGNATVRANSVLKTRRVSP
jgi:hypothetical protein